jgi:hypothetical protein
MLEPTEQQIQVVVLEEQAQTLILLMGLYKEQAVAVQDV